MRQRIPYGGVSVSRKTVKDWVKKLDDSEGPIDGGDTLVIRMDGDQILECRIIAEWVDD